MKSISSNFIKPLVGSAMVLSIISGTFASEPTAPAAQVPDESGGLESFFLGKIPEAFSKGIFNLNIRARYEHVEQEDRPRNSSAGTLRTRFGFTTAPLHGFQAMLEAENITALDESCYNAAGSNGQPDRPVVADPELTQMNQAWLGYNDTNQFSIKAGRQRIVLDNARFVGDVGWRQNQQTFDSVFGSYTPCKDFSLNYGYLWEVNRVFGDVGFAPASAGNDDFESDSHIFNASFSGCQYGKLVGYAYLVDLENSAGTANSCATYGLSFAGSAPVKEEVTLDYRAEFAIQTDYADSLQDYETEYYNLELSASVKPLVVGAGYEVLGSDSGFGFKTPLATLHAFNGWADVFLTTPNNGLQDIYGFAQVALPADIPLRVVYHKFDSDAGSADYGSEIDLVASKKFNKNWSALLKYAYYTGEDAPYAADVQKFWAQVEFNF